MSISEQSFSSMMSSKANNSDPILLTRSGIYKLKTNKNRFDLNSDSTVKQFTINNTTDSNSSISINEINKDSKYNNKSYQPSTNDSNNSSSINEINANRGNSIIQNNYIRPNFLKNSRSKYDTTTTSPTSGIQNRNFHQKNKICTPE